MMDLKTFAVAVYSEAGVADACLTLQDQNQVDVPLLLFCGWYGCFYGPLQQNQLIQAAGISKQLGSHVIKPLRQARRWMKKRSLASGNAASAGADQEQSWDNLREQIKSAELKAELLLLDAFENMVSDQEHIIDKTPQQILKTVIIQNLHMMLQSDTEIGGIDRLLELIGSACMGTAHAGTGQQ